MSFSSGCWPKYSPCTSPRLIAARENMGKNRQLQNVVHEYQAELPSSRDWAGLHSSSEANSLTRSIVKQISRTLVDAKLWLEENGPASIDQHASRI